MPIRITIETRNREAAEIVGHHLGVAARPTSWRGLGVIRMVAADAGERAAVVEAVTALLGERADIGWIRIRYGDEALVFRSNVRRAG